MATDNLRSWRAVLGVAPDGLPHHQPNKLIGNRSAGLNEVSARTKIGDRTRQVAMNKRRVAPVHRCTSAVGHGRSR